MEMETHGSGRHNLIPQVYEFLEGIHFWTLSELLVALKKCQDVLPFANSSSILDRILDCLIERLVLPIVASPCTCSSNGSSFQFSYDASSVNSWKSISSRATWWFEDFLYLKIDLINEIIKRMVSQNFDHATISKFIFYYHKFSCLGDAQAEKHKTREVVINLLSLLDRSSLSCKGLFDLYRVGLRLKLSTSYKNKVESLIGSVLDRVTVDYLLVPPPNENDNHAYDVNLVLRLMQAFLLENQFGISLNRMKKVADLLDSFLLEVAPDPHLEPSKFAALITVLPDYARTSHDQLYLAIDLYLKVHADLGDKAKISICSALDHEKLSTVSSENLAQNSRFPSETKARALTIKQAKSKNFLQETDHLKAFVNSMFCKSFKNNTDMEQTSFDSQKLNSFTEAEELRPDFQGMHWKVMELEKLSGIMQNRIQLTNTVVESRFHWSWQC
ncbi:BTB/POZ domain-containing protein family [Quillaja saponaria]|nr:BTB/POZ domain-containing protein family [Quillaja saponaria]